MINEHTGQLRVSDLALDDDTLRHLHQTIMVVRRDFGALRFNTAIARLMELTSRAARITAADGALPRALAEPLVLMVAPLAPHVAEDLWRRLGHQESVAGAPLPEADQALAAEQAVSLPVQINGKTRFTMQVPAGAGREQIEQLLTAHRDFALYTAGLEVQRVVIVPGRIASVVAR
jgi:leucyl-tRNA synthetase